MDALVALCKRRGFLYGSSEIYNGFAGFFDYGPLGSELKRNIKDQWWRSFVIQRDDVVGLDSSIIASPRVWEASGHVDGFSDPMVDDKGTKKRYRADQLFAAKVVNEDRYVTVIESDGMAAEAKKVAKRDVEDLFCIMDAPPDVYSKLPPPGDASRPGDLTTPRDFNLMFQTNVGATDAAMAYLRPETAQGIFINFKNVASSSRGFKLPCGIAQIGKAFRNEITPRNFIFRSREFEQMEIEYFFDPEADDWQAIHHQWIEACRTFMISRLGIKPELLGHEVHEKVAHYARACTDITFKFPFGEQELQGIAARGDYDLTQHQIASGKSLEYFDEASKRKLLPHVIEPSVGVDRLFLALICSAYEEDVVDGDARSVLKFHPAVAPVKCAVLPLVKKDARLLAIASALHAQIKTRYTCEFDSSGAIGRRYRRQDEIGTPFCVTVDFASLEDRCVTVRDRDTTAQTRIAIDHVLDYITDRIELPAPHLDIDSLLVAESQSGTSPSPPPHK